MKTPQIFDEFGHVVSTAKGAKPIENVIDEFVATKRSENTRKAYTRDLVNAFDYLGVTELQQLGRIQFYDLVASLTQHLELATVYDDETKRYMHGPIPMKVESCRAEMLRACLSPSQILRQGSLQATIVGLRTFGRRTHEDEWDEVCVA